MAISDEVVQIVQILDGYNRHRLAGDASLRAAWAAASNVIGPPVSGGQADRRAGGPTGSPGTSAPGGEIKPAA
jgi:hypothetical protein